MVDRQLGSDLPILYSFRRCPYAMRARMAIAASDTPCRLREIVLRDKPGEMLRASAKGTVPVLVLPDETVIDESRDIMLWALRRHDPENWLKPDRGNLEEMVALIGDAEAGFKPHLDHYKYPNRYRDVDPIEERGKAMGFLLDLEPRLAEAGFLFGGRPALGDIALFPFVRQFANTDADWFAASAPPHVKIWLDGLISTDRFQMIMKKIPVWRSSAIEPVFPWAEEDAL